MYTCVGGGFQADFLKDNMKALPKELKDRLDAIAQGKKRKNRSS
jgi:hypothetical protein